MNKFDPLAGVTIQAGFSIVFAEAIGEPAFSFMGELLTPTEVARILRVSTDSVMRWFGNLPGVIDLGSPETLRKRRYRVIRIPRAVLEKFLIENRVA